MCVYSYGATHTWGVPGQIDRWLTLGTAFSCISDFDKKFAMGIIWDAESRYSSFSSMGTTVLTYDLGQFRDITLQGCLLMPISAPLLHFFQNRMRYYLTRHEL